MAGGSFDYTAEPDAKGWSGYAIPDRSGRRMSVSITCETYEQAAFELAC